MCVSANAATRYVPSSQYSTIQAAINACNHGDTVVVAPDTYTGPGNRAIYFNGKAITVRSETGPENCIIDGEGYGAPGFLFTNAETENSVLDGFTITNFNSCGIYCYSSSPTIRNCIISNNTATYGGGIDCREYSHPNITKCVISGNTSTTGGYGGGGIFCNWGCDPTISNCVITSNSAAYRGGGIYFRHFCHLKLINCEISKNTAYDGGGICHAMFDRLEIINCTIAENIASNNGGGLYLDYVGPPITISNSILWGNTASNSGNQIFKEGYRIPTFSFCDIEGCGGSGGGWDSALGNDGGNNIDIDPRFVDSGAGDYHLIPNSPCNNAGDPSGSYTGQTDIDGEPRVMNGRVDIGADECSEPSDFEKFNACSAGMLCLYNLVAAIPYYGLPGEAAVVACNVKELVESDDIGQALAKNLLLQIIVFDMIEEVAPIQVIDIAQAGYSCLVEFLILEILPCGNFTCIRQEWPELWDEFLNFPGTILSLITRSPVDIKIYDSQGNVMELNTEGYTDNGLPSPGWIFKGPNHQELAIILEADDEYLFEVVGTEGGTYGLDIASVSGGEEITFEAADIPTSPGARHVYAVDWGALSAGEEGVILNIDENGDGFFEQMVIADNELSYDEFALQTETVVDFDPDTLNLKSKGKFATVYIELPEDFDVSEIDPFSLALNELVHPLPKPVEIGDYDSDGTNDLMVKFDLQELIEVLEPGEQMIDLTGRLWDDRPIAGFDFIRVIH